MNSWLIKIKTWISGLYKKVEIQENLPTSTVEKTPEVEISRTPGINCPECSTRLIVSITHLVNLHPLVCSKCGLELVIDPEKSKGALDSLRKLQAGLNQASKVRQESQL